MAGSNWRMRVASFAVLGLFAGGLVAAATPAAGAAVAVPPGACGNVLLAGSAWLGGNGVPVKSNGPDQGHGTSCGGTNKVNGITTGGEWQCVELVNRLYVTRKWIGATWHGNGGRSSASARDSMYDKAPASLKKQPNGSIGYVGPGDVVSINVYKGGVFQPDGHVLIVNSSGDLTSGTVPLVSQNGGDTADAVVKSTAHLSGETLTIPASGSWTYSVIGVVHAPAGGGGSDFNGDGLDDIAWHQGSTLFMLQGTGTGKFGIAGSSTGIGTANWAGVGIDDTTGTPEVYWYQSSASTIYVLRWAGSGWAIVGSTPGISTPDAAVVGDFNGDGLDDIAWHQGSTLFMLQATGNGTFSIAGSSGSIGTPDWSGGGVDDSAGHAEVYWHQGTTIYVLQWGGNGWAIEGSTPGISTPDTAVVGDFNGDGLDDIAWHQGSTLFMLQATGNGTFSIAGSSGSIGTPDWSGGGVDDSAGHAEVYWHQGTTIYVLQWGGSGWAIEGSTPGISTPDAAASSNPAGIG